MIKDEYANTTDEASPLHIACQCGNIAQVKFLVESGANVNALRKDGYLPIHEAAIKGYVHILEYLISAGASLKFPILSTGNTALHLACEIDNQEVVRFLVQNGAPVNLSNKRGRLPLHLACMLHFNVETALLLIDQATDINALDNQACSPLYYAAKFGSVSLVQHLLTLPEIQLSHISIEGLNALHIALRNNHVDIAELLIAHGADVNITDKDGISPLVAAIECNFTSLVPKIIEAGAKLDQVTHIGHAALVVAVQHKNLAVIDLLLTLDTDVNIADDYGCTSTWIAAKEGFMEILQLLIRFNADINIADDDGYTPLHVASKLGNVNVMLLLLSAGADVNIADNENGYTALYLSVKNNHIEATQLLLEYSADINKPDTNGVTPLLASIECGFIDLSIILINHSAITLSQEDSPWFLDPLYMAALNNQVDIIKMILFHKGSSFNYDKSDDKNNNLLMVASRRSSIELFRILIRHQPLAFLLNRSNAEGNTVLHLACIDDNEDAVNELVNVFETESSKLILNCFNIIGETPLLISVRKGSLAIVDILLKAGSDVNLANPNGLSPLILAIKSNNLIIVERLLVDSNIDVDQQDDHGCTALWIASKFGHFAVLNRLLAANADLNKSENNGITPIIIAFKNFKSDVVSVLIQHDAIIIPFNEQNTRKQTHDESFISIEFLSNFCTDNIIGLNLLHQLQDSKLGNDEQVQVSSLNMDILFDSIASNSMEEIIKFVCCPGLPPLILTSIDYKTGGSCMHVAAQHGHVSIIKLLFLIFNDVNRIDKFGRSPLHIACEYGHIEVVRILIIAGSNIYQQTSENDTPLRVACQHGHVEIGLFLIENGAQLQPINDQDNLVHLATNYNQFEFLQMMVNVCIKIETENCDNRILDFDELNGNDGASPLIIACNQGFVRIFEILLAYHRDKNTAKLDINQKDKYGGTPLYYCCYRGNDDLVEQLLQESDIDINNYSLASGFKKQDSKNLSFISQLRGVSLRSPLIAASMNGYHSIVKMLIDASCDLNVSEVKGNTAACVASMKGFYEILLTLIEEEANFNKPNHDGETPRTITEMTVNNHIRRLIDIKVTKHPKACTALVSNHHLRNNIEMKSFRKDTNELKLDKHNQNPNDNNDDDDHYLRESNSSDYSISDNNIHSNAADPNNALDLGLWNRFGNSFIHYMSGFTGILENNSIKMIINSDEEELLMDSNGNTRLIKAVCENKVDVVKSLLQTSNKSSGINRTNHYNRSPLWYASAKGYLEIVYVLIDHNADLNIADEDGFTPLDVAKAYRRYDVVDYLSSFLD
eukprot:gene5334-7401_t